MATIQSAFSVPQATYGLLSDLSLLSVHWGTYPQFIEKYPSLAKQSYIMISEASGALAYSPTRDFYHWEPQGKDLAYIQSTAPVTGSGAGDPITITLAASSYTPSGKSPIAEGFVFQNLTSGQVYRVSAVSKTTPGAHTATLQITDSTLTAAVTADDFLVYQGNQFVEEGSSAYDGYYREEVRIDGTMKTIRSDKEFTDRNVFEKVESPNGGYKFKNAQMEWERTEHFIAVQEMMLMLGIDANNLGAYNSASKGLLEQVKEYSGNLTQGQTVVDDTFWETLVLQVKNEGYTSEVDMLSDTGLYLKMSAYLRSNYNNGAILYERVENDRPMGLSSAFKSYNIDGVKFNFHDYAYFNPSKTHGVPIGTASIYSDSALLIPIGEAKDARTGQPMQRFRVRYSAEYEGAPAVRVWYTGGLSPAQNDDQAVIRYHAMADKGVETFALNGFGYVKI